MTDFTTRRYVNPPSLMPPRGFNNGVVLPTSAAGGVLFVAGQIGADAAGTIVSSRFTDQFEQALINVVAVVRESGAAPEAIGKLTIFVTDKAAYVAQRRAIGLAYRRHMGRHYPAMTLVEVKSLLDPAALVEIEAIAVI